MLPPPFAGSPRAASISGGHGMTFNPMHGAAQPHAQPGPSPLSSEAPPSAAREALGPAAGQVRTELASGSSPSTGQDKSAPSQARSNRFGILGANSCCKVRLSNAWFLLGQQISLFEGVVTILLDRVTHPSLDWHVLQTPAPALKDVKGQEAGSGGFLKLGWKAIWALEANCDTGTSPDVGCPCMQTPLPVPWPSVAALQQAGTAALLQADAAGALQQRHPYLYAWPGDLRVGDVARLLELYKELVLRHEALVLALEQHAGAVQQQGGKDQGWAQEQHLPLQVRVCLLCTWASCIAAM